MNVLSALLVIRRAPTPLVPSNVPALLVLLSEPMADPVLTSMSVLLVNSHCLRVSIWTTTSYFPFPAHQIFPNPIFIQAVILAFQSASGHQKCSGRFSSPIYFPMNSHSCDHNVHCPPDDWEKCATNKDCNCLFGETPMEQPSSWFFHVHFHLVTSDFIATTEISLFSATDDCDINADCENTWGGYECTCVEGYAGSGTAGNCDNINECAANTNLCVANSICVDTVGSYSCFCAYGYAASLGECVNIDDCALGHRCDQVSFD